MPTRRERLVALALDLLEREGLDGFGVGSLARAAGIKPPSLYKHFAGRGDIEHALISQGFRDLGRALAKASAGVRSPHDQVAAFARVYRAQALDRPQLYRLMTDRPLDRQALDPGAEQDGMAALLAFFGEKEGQHDRSRAAWAWAHGLASLEIAGRFPPGADVDAAWTLLVDTLAAWVR